jgi:hypothetical protein
VGEGLFTADLFGFLEDLKRHNDRAWFSKNKERYLDVVQEPAIEFVRAFAPSLARISPQFVPEDRPVGGSLFRIYRDVRFSKDKSPYKTHVGISFRHRNGKDVQAPGYYLHLEPGQVFVAAVGPRASSRLPRHSRALCGSDLDRARDCSTGQVRSVRQPIHPATTPSESAGKRYPSPALNSREPSSTILRTVASSSADNSARIGPSSPAVSDAYAQYASKSR